ncbi:mucin-19 [Aplysia californica]|uniref:protein-tyrosine-phosphatase n=1 Tax=Aplysia californica TaxID=6500 RepID=A0ABM0K672_APLCA|nr:mucin-19 [Aplysia californica]
MPLMAAVPAHGTGKGGGGGDGKHGSMRHISAAEGGGRGSGDADGVCDGGSGFNSAAATISVARGASPDYGLLEMDENDNSFPWGLIHHNELAQMLTIGLGKTMVIDSRSFLEYNTSNIQQSVNVCCSKLVKRRLQQDKVHILDLLHQTCNIGADVSWDVIVYDQCTEDPSQLTADNFVQVLLRKLSTTFNSVAFLKGGFLAFQASHSSLIDHKSSTYRCSTLTSLSQPCMPVSNVGPTRILPFLYLGSQQDSLNQELAQVNGISYILNVSKTCPRPPYILEGHFHRIPVNDNYCEKLLPYFQEAFQFLDKVREANGCVLVHCLGGVSRSATLAIAYIMKHMRMSSDEAYRYVKDKRPTISPNFNFLGQLLEFEKLIRKEEQEEVARREALRVLKGAEDYSLSCEQDKASPVMMDLHTTSPSSPGPRSSSKSFVLESLTSTAFSSPLQTLSFKLPENRSSLNAMRNPSASADNFKSLDVRKKQTDLGFSLHKQAHTAFDSSPFPRPISELYPVSGPASLEDCPFPGPSSLIGWPELRSACVSQGPSSRSSSNNTTVSSLQTSIRQCGVVQPFCDSLTHASSTASTTLVESPVCALTGFPSPAGAYQDSPESTCPRTGFPRPGHHGSIDSNSNRITQICMDSTCSSISPRYTSLEEEKLIHEKSTYQHNTGPDTATMAPPPPIDKLNTTTSLLVQSKRPGTSQLGARQTIQKSKHSFSFTSMLSSFRRKPRPPTLQLGSPVGHSTELLRAAAGEARTQLTPVSEAMENCDLSVPEDESTGVDQRVCVGVDPESRMELQDSNSVVFTGVSDCSLSNATSMTMASTQINLYSSLSSSLPSKDSSLHVQNTMLQTMSLKLDQKHCVSTVSSVTVSDAQMAAYPISSSPSVLSSGDSNKRKGGGFLSSFISPDKLAKTESSFHHGPMETGDSKLSPPRTLNLAPSPVNRLRLHSTAKKPSGLTLSSPTTAMARLNFKSPSDASKDFCSSVAAAQSEGRSPVTAHATNSRLDLEESVKICGSQREFKLSSFLTCSEQLIVGEKQQGLGAGSDNAGSTTNVAATSSEPPDKQQFNTSSYPPAPPGDRSLLSCSSSSSGSSTSHPEWSSMSKSSSASASTWATSSSSHSEMSSSSSISSSTSSSRNFRGLGDFPTTSLDKLNFTPCSVRDIVQELKNEELSLQTAGYSHSSQTGDSQSASSALDSPMSISSGSSAPSIASSTLSPVESGMANPFSDAVTQGSSQGLSASSMPSAFHFSPVDNLEPPSPNTSFTLDGHSGLNARDNQLNAQGNTQQCILSPDSASGYALSSTSLPQASVSPKMPTVSSPLYSSCSSMEPLSPMSLSDSASSSPIRSPTSNGISSLSLSTVYSPIPVSSPLAVSSSFPSSVIAPAASLHSHIQNMSSPLATNPSLSTPAAASTKVVRRRDSRSRREMARPNSIAYSSYPTCDLVCESGDSNTVAISSHDDASEVYMSVTGKKSKLAALTPESQLPSGRTSWGGYSEREVYRQISAAMESAMLRTRAYTSGAPSASSSRLAQSRVSSRKARSLDDILDSSTNADELQHKHRGGGRYHRAACGEQLFEPYRCGLRSGSEPYQSSSSLSSNGSHGSIHNSLEIIQLPR